MRVNPFTYGLLVLSIFLGVILGFRAVGFWSISGKVTAGGEKVAPVPGDVESIKGWMTLGDISTAFYVPVGEILATFQLPADTSPATAIKDLESDQFSVSDLRDWLGARQGEQPAVPLDEPKVATTPDVNTLPPLATIPADEVGQDETGISTVQAHTGVYDPSNRRVTGQTTFQDLLDMGLQASLIEQVIDGELPSLTMLVKDYVIQKGLPFENVREALQAEVDRIQP